MTSSTTLSEKENETWVRFVQSTIEYTAVYDHPQYITEPGNVYVLNVEFLNQNTNGSIRIESNQIILVSQTFFSNSSSTENGGSMFIKDGLCFQYRVCCIKSTTPKLGGHSYAQNNGASEFIECSISRCNSRAGSFYIRGGGHNIEYTNISYGSCTFNGAYACTCTIFQRNVVNRSSIFNNTADQDCVLFHGTGTHNMDHNKIIKNAHNKVDFNFGIINNWDCDFIISNCIFMDNSGPSLFYKEYDRGSFLVKNCLMKDNNVEQPSSGNPVEIIETNSLSFSLSHLSTKRCINLNLLHKRIMTTSDTDCDLLFYPLIICAIYE